MDYEHVSWCAGTHDSDGECLVERSVNGEVSIDLRAVPCSHVNLQVDGVVVDVNDLNTLIGYLDELRPLLAAADKEATCEGHDHSDENDWTGPITDNHTDDEAADEATDGM